ncbi:MAG: MFS transporter [Thermanaerothrix sp.]|uniref:MFS transporter n=1 Tax=Thermanaerothrix sp. TaxID=2972675 RepID=UPI003C7D4AFE
MQNPKTRLNAILFVLFVGVLMGALDIAILGPALPSIRAEFAVEERTLSWMFSAYVLASLISTTLMAKLSDLFGRRWIYAADVGLFALGSLLVVIAPRFEWVVLGRAVQGLGAGGIFPVASAVIGDVYPPERRGRALGMIGAVFGLAFLIGPLLGGVILAVASWHWLFLINVPLAVVLIVFSLRLLPAQRATRRVAFDAVGLVLLSLTLLALALGLNRLDVHQPGLGVLRLEVGGFLGASVLFLIGLVAWERRAPAPLLPGYLFDRRQLRLAYLLSGGAGFGEATLVFVPLMAVTVLGRYGINERNATWLLIPAILAMAVGSPLIGRLLDRIGSRLVILGGTLLMTVGFVLLSLGGGQLAPFLSAGVLIGIGMSSLLGAPIRYIMLGEARAEERSLAQGLISIFTSVGQLVGSAIMGALTTSLGRTNPAYGYQMAFGAVAVISLVLFALSTQLKSRQQERQMIPLGEVAAHG